MTRIWDEAAAAIFDVIPGGLLLFILIFLAILTSVLWYWYPRWLPQRLPRLRLPKRAKRNKSNKKTKKAEKSDNDEGQDQDRTAATDEPTIPLPGNKALADRLAAEGRYADAIRQRLRDVMGDLTAAGIVHPQPGSTPAELAASAAAHRPDVAAPLDGATDLFSGIWYGDQPAGPAQDDRMRALAQQVREHMQSAT